MLQAILAIPVIFWATFIIYVAAMHAKIILSESGARGLGVVGFTMLVIAAGLGWFLDVLLNWTVFLALGVTKNLTLSNKLKHIRRTHTKGWRLRVANYICDKMLCPFDPGHC